jgi:hypothetical protein
MIVAAVLLIAFLVVILLLVLPSRHRFIVGFQALLADPDGLSKRQLWIIDRALGTSGVAPDECPYPEDKHQLSGEADPEEAEREPRVLVVPKDRMRALLELWDVYQASTAGSVHVARFDFWAEAEAIFPEVATESWVFVSAPFNSRFVEEV